MAFRTTQGVPRILIVRLGAMGDVIHALPAAASLKQSFPESLITWVIEPRWLPLLEDNPFISNVLVLERGGLRPILRSWRRLRKESYDHALDFQGLIKSAAVASASRAAHIYGFANPRERVARILYSERVEPKSVHVVDRNLELAEAAGASALVKTFFLPPGRIEGELPSGSLVLASPLAGWASKQWPIENYQELGTTLRRELGVPLVLNGPPGSGMESVTGLPGLIYATRRATAVIGVDSGPMHLAAALGKPGIAIFGPTDPARNGPYGGSLRVLRVQGAVTTYRRGKEIDPSMRRIGVDEVFENLRAVLRECHL